MLVITLEQSNIIDFDLALNGDVGPDVKVVLTIDCGTIAYRFPATQLESVQWQAVIPESVAITEGQYDFYIDVIVDNHIYPAMQDSLQVKKPLKPVASLPNVVKSAPSPVAKAPTVAVRESVPKPAGFKAASIRRVIAEP